MTTSGSYRYMEAVRFGTSCRFSVRLANEFRSLTGIVGGPKRFPGYRRAIPFTLQSTGSCSLAETKTETQFFGLPQENRPNGKSYISVMISWNSKNTQCHS